MKTHILSVLQTPIQQWFGVSVGVRSQPRSVCRQLQSVQVDIQQGKYSGRTPAFFSGICDIYSWERGRLERNQGLWINPVWLYWEEEEE